MNQVLGRTVLHIDAQPHTTAATNSAFGGATANTGTKTVCTTHGAALVMSHACLRVRTNCSGQVWEDCV
jgi:hypothetical protein